MFAKSPRLYSLPPHLNLVDINKTPPRKLNRGFTEGIYYIPRFFVTIVSLNTNKYDFAKCSRFIKKDENDVYQFLDAVVSGR